MNQKELKNLVDEIFADARSIKEDVEYGIKANQKIRLSEKEQTQLSQISNQLMNLAEQIGIQFIIQDFEWTFLKYFSRTALES